MSFFKKIFKTVGSMLGITESPAQEQARKQAEAQARALQNQQQQALILQNANEQAQLVQVQEGGIFDDTTASGVRRKKQASGGATAGLGITI